jgi:Fe-S-cluster-containing hydrogenase component 2
MTQRKIVQIDEVKCNGCGLCVPSCAEGAIQIIDGKARLVADVYCDGLGACLGECPQGAITIVQREAGAFDEEAARQQAARAHGTLLPVMGSDPSAAGGCPGSAVRSLHPEPGESPPGARVDPLSRDASEPRTAAADTASSLGNWPVQLNLIPPNAPFLQNADLLLVADCVPFALADFHARFLRGRAVVIGCPKLDDTGRYIEKLAAIFNVSSPKSLTVVHMEVPCCTGLLAVARTALHMCGKKIPLRDVTISIRGKVIATV